MTMPVCKVCKGEKPNREMAMGGGGVTATGLEGKAEKKAKRNGGAVKADPPASPSPTPPPAPSLPRPTVPREISVAPSLGFTASVDGNSLVIAQANGSRENDDDNITLTREEAKALFDTFGEWI